MALEVLRHHLPSRPLDYLNCRSADSGTQEDAKAAFNRYQMSTLGTWEESPLISLDLCWFRYILHLPYVTVFYLSAVLLHVSFVPIRSHSAIFPVVNKVDFVLDWVAGSLPTGHLPVGQAMPFDTREIAAPSARIPVCSEVLNSSWYMARQSKQLH